MSGGASPQYHFCKILTDPSSASAQGAPGAPLSALLNTAAQLCRRMSCNSECMGEIAGGRDAARATASRLIARSPPAMSPKGTHKESWPQGLLDGRLTACPVAILWTERQKELLRAFPRERVWLTAACINTPGDYLQVALAERGMSSLPPRHEGREGF